MRKRRALGGLPGLERHLCRARGGVEVFEKAVLDDPHCGDANLRRDRRMRASPTTWNANVWRSNYGRRAALFRSLTYYPFNCWSAHSFDFRLHWTSPGYTCSRPRARISGPKARRPNSTLRSRRWRQPCRNTKSAKPRLPSSREKFFRISRGSKASMAILGLRPVTPANRRTGITSTMDGKRVPPSSSAMRLTCWRRWRSKPPKAASIGLDDIGALIVNTITGLAIPSLDAKLMNRLQLPHSVERLPIFGLGCGGGVGGLARAARYAQAMPAGSHVLFLTIDLCSLCLRIADPSTAMFVAAALFGDGAAGVVLRNTQGSR